jgi:hypothetical protein
LNLSASSGQSVPSAGSEVTRRCISQLTVSVARTAQQAINELSTRIDRAF